MLVSNNTSQDLYFGPLRVAAGASNVTIDDTSATSLYLLSDAVADTLNNAWAAGKISVTGQADPFPRPTGIPQLLHGDGSPDGLVYAPQGSLYMRRDGSLNNGGILYQKTTGVTSDTGWTADVASQVVATTITGLGSGFPGAQGILRLGSSPYDFLGMSYDGSYGKWVSQPQQVASGWNVGAGNPGLSWYDLAAPVLMEWAAFYAAGLKLQAKFVINGRDTSNNQNNTQARIVTGHFAASGAPPTNTTAYGATSIGGMNYLTSITGEVPWTDVTPANDTYLSIEFQSSNQDSNNHSYVFSGTGYIRWTS